MIFDEAAAMEATLGSALADLRVVSVSLSVLAAVALVLTAIGLYGVLAAIGLLIGLSGAYGGSRLLEQLLFETRPLDPGTYVSAMLFLGLVALLACLLPAWQAARVDPVLALRTE